MLYQQSINYNICFPMQTYKEQIINLIVEMCEKCLLNIEFAQLVLARQAFQQLPRKEKKQWIIEYLPHHHKQTIGYSHLYNRLFTTNALKKNQQCD